MTDTSGAGPAPRKVKVGFYQDPHEAGEARAAYLATHQLEGHRSFSDFIAAAVRHEVLRLQTVYNDGDTWGDAAPGDIPAGRPRAADDDEPAKGGAPNEPGVTSAGRHRHVEEAIHSVEVDGGTGASSSRADAQEYIDGHGDSAELVARTHARRSLMSPAGTEDGSEHETMS